MIAKAPGQYGFVINPNTRPQWETVTVASAYDLRVVAECVGQPVETVRQLNPELRRLATPADRSYGLRVPPGTGGVLRTCLDELPAEKRVAYRKHVVRRGQTLASIALPAPSTITLIFVPTISWSVNETGTWASNRN